MSANINNLPDDRPSDARVRVACPNNWMRDMAAPASIPLSQVVETLAEIAPPHLAEPWDNVGLLSGDPTGPVKTALLAIDLTEAVAHEAISLGADLLVCYHPPMFKPQSRFVVDRGPAAMAALLARYGIAVYSPHTALDAAEGGTNDALAKVLGIRVTDSFGHGQKQGKYLKLITFAPKDAIEKIADAMFDAGAGDIGEQTHYSRCSFRVEGVGTFMGDESTHPAVGQAGRMERVEEVRIETILPEDKVVAVVRALNAAHPYEQPAFDLSPLQTPPEKVGPGRIGHLEPPRSLEDFARRCASALGCAPAVVGERGRMISAVALMAGSAGSAPLDARGNGDAFDCLVTGELKHHDQLRYAAAGVAAICLGHGESERPVLPALAAQMRDKLPTLNVALSQADIPPAWTP